MPFPGGAEAALEFAAYEKGLLERGGNGKSREQHITRQAPISEPNRHSTCWMLAGAGMAAAVAAILLLLSSGLLATGFAAVLRAIAPP